MTLRIFEEPGETEETVALHGWLRAAEVPELDRVAAAHHRPLKIDLANLAGVDPDGLRALVRFQRAGVRLVRATPFVALLIEHAAQEAAAKDAVRNGGDE